MVRMTPRTAVTEKTYPPRVRTLGLTASSQRARMAKAYEDYAAAQLIQVRLHNAWRRTRRRYSLTFSPPDKHPRVKAARTKADKAALALADKKAQYAIAKAEARAAA